MKNIDSDLIRGNIDTIILKTMLNEDKYGLDIIKEVEQRSNGTYELKQPTLYSCLKRLENQELISSYWLNSDIGGRRHYYKLTEKGREFYNKKQEEWAKSKFVIDNLLSNYNYEEYRLVKKDDYDKVINAASDIADKSNIDIDADLYDNDNQLNEDTKSHVEDSDDNNFETNIESGEENYSNENFETDETYNESSLDYDEVEEYNETDSPNLSFENENTDQDEVVYVSNEYDSSEFEDEDITKSSASYELQDQTQNESNILSMLRKQNDEEINTYEGDKKSYAHHLKSIYDDVKYVQDDMIFVNDDEDDEVEQKIQEFEEAARELNNFENENDEFTEDHDENLNLYEDVENESDEIVSQDTTEELNFEDIENNSNDDDFENELETDELEEFNFGYQEDDEQITDFDNELTEDLDTTAYNQLDESFDFSTSDDEQVEEDSKFNSFDSYNSRDSSFFASNDITSYEDESNNTIINETFEEYKQPTKTFDSNELNDFGFSPASFDSYSNKFNKDEYDSTFVNVKKDISPESISDFDSNNSVANTDIDSIISKNAYDFESTKPHNSDFFERRYVTENYKQKLSNLTIYSKVSNEAQKVDVQSESSQADDMETLKLNFEREGIKVKEYKKITSFEEPEKTYLLANKINLIKSLILLFGYVFVLSAMYIILQNSVFGEITEDFGIKYFLFGMIPFAIVAIYHLAIYIVNPYKKVPARYASRIMMFLAVILTVQLLLITYCVNLQLGFYSFTQAGYNHLLWVIPSMISFGPIISNLIYMALFHSGNFNV